MLNNYIFSLMWFVSDQKLEPNASAVPIILAIQLVITFVLLYLMYLPIILENLDLKYLQQSINKWILMQSNQTTNSV